MFVKVTIKQLIVWLFDLINGDKSFDLNCQCFILLRVTLICPGIVMPLYDH